MEECSSIKNKNNNDCREEEEEEEEGGEAGKEGVSAERMKKGKDENEEGEEEAVVVEEGEKEELPPHPSRRARRKMTPAERALYPTQCQRQVYLQVGREEGRKGGREEGQLSSPFLLITAFVVFLYSGAGLERASDSFREVAAGSQGAGCNARGSRGRDEVGRVGWREGGRKG